MRNQEKPLRDGKRGTCMCCRQTDTGKRLAATEIRAANVTLAKPNLTQITLLSIQPSRFSPFTSISFRAEGFPGISGLSCFRTPSFPITKRFAIDHFCSSFRNIARLTSGGFALFLSPPRIYYSYSLLPGKITTAKKRERERERKLLLLLCRLRHL